MDYLFYYTKNKKEYCTPSLELALYRTDSKIFFYINNVKTYL